MTYKYNKRKIDLKILLLSLVIATGLVIFSQYSLAQSGGFALTVNGGSTEIIDGGETATLEWSITKGASDAVECVISDGTANIQTIPASGDMVRSGTLPVTPSIDTTYTLDCGGYGTDQVSVFLSPAVTITAVPNGPSISGNADSVLVSWTSQRADSCSKVWRVNDGSSTILWSSNAGNPDRFLTAGSLEYNGFPQPEITATTTFYITCYNATIGAETTSSVLYVPTLTPPPPPPSLSMWTSDSSIDPDPILGYAYADVHYQQDNVNGNCDLFAYYGDSISTPNLYSPLPTGYGGSVAASGSFINIPIATTTTFSIECEHTDSSNPVNQIVQFINASVVVYVSDLDRSTLPPVTASLVANPNPTPLGDETTIEVTAKDAQYCLATAFDSTGTEYNLTNWTRTESHNRLNGIDNSYSFDVTLSTTTILVLDCQRPYDVQFGDSVEQDLGQEVVELVVNVQETLAPGTCISTGPGSVSVVPSPPGFGPNPTTGICEPDFDVQPASPAVNLSSAVPNGVDGTYDSIDALLVIENLGPGDVDSGLAINYVATLNFDPALSLPPVTSSVGTYNLGISAPSSGPGESPTLTRNFTNVPFGNHELCVTVNESDTLVIINEAGLGTSNNTTCSQINLAVPPPPMDFTTSQSIIRAGQTVTLSWDVNASYTLNCVLRGAGGIDEVFTVPSSGNIVTGPLSSNSRFILQCTEPVTGAVFNKELSVSVVPEFQEL